MYDVLVADTATGGVLQKKRMFLKISQNSQENTCARFSPVPQAWNFIKKEALVQVLYRENRHHRATASVVETNS